MQRKSKRNDFETKKYSTINENKQKVNRFINEGNFL